MTKHHPLNWFMERYERFIDIGTIFAIVLITGVVAASVVLEGEQAGHPKYFDRQLP